MKKEFLAIILLVMLFACKSDDDTVLSSIKLDKTELTLKVGEEYTFKVIKNPEDAPTPSYTWSVENVNDEIGVIDKNGNFKALSVGEVNILVEAYVEGKIPLTSNCIVTVEPVDAEGLKLDKQELALNVGASETVICSFVPENTTNKKLLWKSSNPKIASVSFNYGTSENSKITAIGEGEAIITAYLKENEKISAQCKVKVSPTKLENLTLKETEKTII